MSRTFGPLALVLPLAALLAACSGGTPGTTTTSGGPTPSAGSSSAPAGQAGGAVPGADQRGGVSGRIAYVSGQLMQVQDSDSQTAVTWTDATTISAVVDGTLADVVPGVCVVAVEAATAEASSDGSADAATPASTGGVATRVSVTQPVDGECGVAGFGGMPAGGFAGGTAGGRPTDLPTDLPSDLPTDLPSGMPTDFPSGAADGMRLMGAVTAGRVTAVTGSQITVETTAADGTASTAAATVDGSTTYTTTVTSDASAIVVGQCVTARGDADSSGAVAATSLSVTAPVDGACTSVVRGAFGGMRGGMGTAPGGTGSPAQAGTTTGGSGA